MRRVFGRLGWLVFAATYVAAAALYVASAARRGRLGGVALMHHGWPLAYTYYVTQPGKVIVGGAPITEEWVQEIGADAAGFDAGNAVQKAINLMEDN